MARRAPLVLAGTLAGLVGLLSFRTTPAAVSLVGTTPSSSTPTTAPATATTAGASPPTTSGSRRSHAVTTTPVTHAPTTVVAPTTTTPTTTTTTTTTASGLRSATGPKVNYVYGILSVTVTASGSQITSVKIATLDDGGNPQSQYIDQQSIPMLISQVMAAQSSHIQGVSGATYTSEGFYTSLLAALKQLGLK
jgi:uncharacterized protein with FMN-binding domain